MKKFTKQQVKFEHPGMGKQKCKACTYFNLGAPARDGCRIVEGLVYPRDWCQEFLRRKHA